MIQQNDRILDVACGPGYVAAIASEKGGVVTGIDFSKEDVIMISDVDEIPRASTVKTLKKLLKQSYRGEGPMHQALAVEQEIYYFHLNRQTPTGACWGDSNSTHKWHGTVATTFGTLKGLNPQYFRELRDKTPHLKDGGWHFTWMGGKDKIRQKHASVAERRDEGLLICDA